MASFATRFTTAGDRARGRFQDLLQSENP